jgi:hypothetical protein
MKPITYPVYRADVSLCAFEKVRLEIESDGAVTLSFVAIGGFTVALEMGVSDLSSISALLKAGARAFAKEALSRE